MMKKSLLFGRCAVSMPFLSYGGMLADDDVAEEVLLAEAKRAVIEE